MQDRLSSWQQVGSRQHFPGQPGQSMDSLVLLWSWCFFVCVGDSCNSLSHLGLCTGLHSTLITKLVTSLQEGQRDLTKCLWWC